MSNYLSIVEKLSVTSPGVWSPVYLSVKPAFLWSLPLLSSCKMQTVDIPPLGEECGGWTQGDDFDYDSMT